MTEGSAAGPWGAIPSRWRRFSLIYLALGGIFAIADFVPYVTSPLFNPIAIPGLLYMAPVLALMWPFWLLMRLFAGVPF